jgi:ADP-ribose pyrophosphatase YjhB (NUDIX family)
MPSDLPSPRRDLPPGQGLLRRAHLLFGDLLILAVGQIRPPFRLGVRLLAFDDAGRVFLVRHSYIPGWHLPGGGVERGETTRHAVTREAEEEGGLRLCAPPDLFGLYLHPTTARLDHIAVFLAHGVTREEETGQGAEIRGAEFFPPDALPEGASLATRARIIEALGGPRSDHW